MFLVPFDYAQQTFYQDSDSPVFEVPSLHLRTYSTMHVSDTDGALLCSWSSDRPFRVVIKPRALSVFLLFLPYWIGIVLPVHIIALPLLWYDNCRYFILFPFFQRLLNRIVTFLLVSFFATWLCIGAVSVCPVLCLVFCPVYSCIKSTEYRKHRFSEEPRGLPRKRKRRLSEGHIVQQRTSMFLTRLPAEIRLMIYRLVIVGDSTHWHITECRNVRVKNDLPVRTFNTIRAFKTKTNRMHEASVARELELQSETAMGQAATQGYNSHGRMWPDEVDEQMLQRAILKSNLNLTRTCRQIYLETINMPYGQCC